MMLLRIIARGRLSEFAPPTEDTLRADVFMRHMGFYYSCQGEEDLLSPRAAAHMQAYCDGVNAYLSNHRVPFELRLLRYKPEPWSTTDSLATIKLMSFMGLAQTQLDLEKLIAQSLAAGLHRGKLNSLFSPHLDEMDDELVGLLARTRIVDELVPPSVRLGAGVPTLKNSNNWVVASKRSETGGALAACDPHLEVNRLPAIWYEWIGTTRDKVRAGISMPGVPGLVMGRTDRISMSFTYGFMDMVDYFIEEVRDGSVRRSDGWAPIFSRRETIRRRRMAPVEIEIRETSHGVIEAPPDQPLADGLVLCRAWSGYRGGAARSIDAMVDLMNAADVEEACNAASKVAISANWLFADNRGRIAFQQSGVLPRRAHSGLFPVPGWDERFAWKGVVEPHRLSRIIDPEEGVLFTANEDVDVPGYAKAINACRAGYRSARIGRMLAEQARLGLEGMKRMQRDLYSVQAERFIEQWESAMPDTTAAKSLLRWDRRYDVHSLGAPIFERCYRACLEEVFGRGLFGQTAWTMMVEKTPLLVDYHSFLDRVLLGDEPLWWPEGKASTLRRVLGSALAEPPTQMWGDRQKIEMRNILLGGKAPAWLELDYGPLPLPGNRATICQGEIFQTGGRTSTFAPSWRCVTDLSTSEMHTALAGGVSARRSSRYYLSDVERWRHFTYKTLRLVPS